MTPCWHRTLVALLGMLLALPAAAATEGAPPELPLRRAIFEWASRDKLMALLELEQLDPAALDRAMAERGQTLLAHLYRDEGDARFVELCASQLALTDARLHDHLAQLWLREALRNGSDQQLVPTVHGELALLAAAVALDRGDGDEALAQLQTAPEKAIRHYLRACALELEGQDPTPALDAALREPDPAFADGARIWRASLAAERGVDPSPWLDAVDVEGAYAQRARHMRALWRFERGDETVAATELQQMLEGTPYAGARDVRQMLGAMALERSDPEAALAHYLAAERDWIAEDDRLASLLASESPQSALTARSPLLHLDEDGLNENDAKALSDLRDLREDLPSGFDQTMPLSASSPAPHRSLRLEKELRDELRATQRALRAAIAEERRQNRIADEEERLLASLRRHRDRGWNQLNGALPEFLRGSAELDSIAAVLDDVLARLNDVRDSELQRIAQRTKAMLERARRHAGRMHLLEQLYVLGPMGRLDQRLLEETPRPAEIFERDDTLADSLGSFVERFALEAPAIIARSHDEIWRPRLVGDAPLLQARARELVESTRLLTAAIDSARAAETTSPALEAARDAAAAAANRRMELSALADSLLITGARDAIARARAANASEREGIDYGLAAASYDLAADLADSGATGAAIVALRRDGIARLQAFLKRHPQSAARGESRFRLADLILSDARDRFHEDMERYLQTKTGDVPQLDYSPALALYGQILEEDLDYPHRDATRFHLGMILADLGDPSATGELNRLLSEHGDTEFAQPAHLRLGDMAFDAQDFRGASEHFEAATRGDDADITAIALYKLGWSEFNTDRYLAAADAFRRLLDQYEAGFSTSEEIDLRTEAEDDLVHALARAGGAATFEDYFAGIGGRDYEPQLLSSLSRLLRRYALYAEAIQSDELYLQRFGTRAGALDAAKRLLDSHGNHSGAEKMSQVQMELAERFRPDGAWAAAQSDSSVVAEASSFSRKGIRNAALAAHRNAKDGGNGSWSLALGHYQTLLTLWPEDGEAPRFSLLAGECALELAEYQDALDHFTAAAASDTASFRGDAAWLRVVSCERWYDSSRPTLETAGDERLAAQLLDVGESYLADHPATKRAVELRWRDGNLRFLHGWYEDAAASLATFVERHPTDERAFDAAKLQGESHYRLERFDAAADAYQTALALRGQRDGAQLAALVPHCRYRHAEQVADADSSGSAQAAPLFARVAREYPQFEHAPLALYRAGSGYAAGDETATAVAQWTTLVERHPRHELAPDAQRRIAQTWRDAGEKVAAAQAYEAFCEKFPEQSDAADALMLAAELLGEAGDPAAQRRLEDRYLDRYPEDVETAFTLREERAAKELDGLGAASIGSLLTGGGELASYLKLAKEHPEEASPSILARVAFLEAEQKREDYLRLRLTQPLDASLARKQTALESVLSSYGACVEQAIQPWAQASAHRVGEALVHFGDSLVEAEVPAELSGEDVLAYREVLEEQSWQFYDRGEEAWSQLLRETEVGDDEIDPWLERTRDALYPRIAERFLHRPEAVLPRIPASPTGASAR